MKMEIEYTYTGVYTASGIKTSAIAMQQGCGYIYLAWPGQTQLTMQSAQSYLVLPLLGTSRSSQMSAIMLQVFS